MKLIEKNAAFIRLKNGDYLEPDLRLLKKKNPEHPALKQSFFDNKRKGKEILYALLDHATEEEIILNRKGGGSLPESVSGDSVVSSGGAEKKSPVPGKKKAGKKRKSIRR